MAYEATSQQLGWISCQRPPQKQKLLKTHRIRLAGANELTSRQAS